VGTPPSGYAAGVNDPVYTAEVTSTGGRTDGRARSTDGNLDLRIATPGSGAEGTNPEELFAAGYAACFASAFLLGARRAKADIDGIEVTAEVTLGKQDDGGYGLAVTLRVQAPGIPQATADELIAVAHEGCPYSRATRGNVEVVLQAVGAA
jgi:lipoyl-dependent peroxiredoxin